MNDILIETCNYIYKNPGFSTKKYIREMSERSIWRGINVEDKIDYMIYLGVLKEVEKYSKVYDKEYTTLEIDLNGFINLYNNDFKNESVICVLKYVQKHLKKSDKTFQKDFTEMIGNDKEYNEYLESFLKLKNYGVLRLKSEYFNDYKYYGLRIDFAQLRDYILNNKNIKKEEF